VPAGCRHRRRDDALPQQHAAPDPRQRYTLMSKAKSKSARVNQSFQGQRPRPKSNRARLSARRANDDAAQSQQTEQGRTIMPDTGILTDRSNAATGTEINNGEPFDPTFYRRTFGEWSAETIATSGNGNDPHAERAEHLYCLMVRNNAPTPATPRLSTRSIRSLAQCNADPRRMARDMTPRCEDLRRVH
jgi:hypothetical protein